MYHTEELVYGSLSGGGETGLEAAISLGAVLQLAPPVQLPPRVFVVSSISFR